jgi:hypothetical protein
MTKINLRIPIIVMVLAAIIVPIELRSPGRAALDFGFDAPDFFANIAGFIPIGIVLGEFGLLRGVILAALMSIFAETGQLWMMHRDPSVMDVVANTTGAIIGAVIAGRWQIRSLSFTTSRLTTLLAVALSIILIVGLFATSSHAVSDRGLATPGILEANWKFDGTGNRIALDRLRGSMTISAWIKSTSYPKDDAAIVSQLHGGSHYSEGFQLDTTIDRGPRTIGFKLSNDRGELMARYGATPLALNTRYHVAGVYDADNRTLDVYLDGKPDNGFLLGSVTGSQHSSRGNVFVGRRSDSKGYEFAGLIDKVHIYSFPLNQSDIAADMAGKILNNPVQIPANRKSLRDHYAVISDSEDAQLPAAAAVLGVLLAVACLGFWPSAGISLSLIAGFAAGLLVHFTRASTLPAFNSWLLPLVSLIAGISIVASTETADKKIYLSAFSASSEPLR